MSLQIVYSLYRYFKDAKERKLLVKSNNKTEVDLIGKTWPNKTVFLDFINPDTQSLWLNGLQSLYNQASMDGILINSDEAFNFCNKE